MNLTPLQPPSPSDQSPQRKHALFGPFEQLLDPDSADSRAVAAEHQKEMLEVLASTLDLADCHSMEGEISVLCHAFSAGVSPQVRRDRARIAARLAGGEGLTKMPLQETAKAAAANPKVVLASARKTFGCIAQASHLQLVPPCRHLLDAVQGPQGARQLVATRFAHEVLGLEVPMRALGRLKEAYEQAEA